ncbi:Protein still life [Blattella germanica]|nr:Protein still life [Blattella germanica]
MQKRFGAKVNSDIDVIAEYIRSRDVIYFKDRKKGNYKMNTKFLSVKKWLLRKKHQIELARKRGWKGYWVCLKGTTLLFYPCDSREGRSVEAAPKHLIIVDGAIMQPIPEHPKRDYIFCLSTAFGDAYLFQVRTNKPRKLHKLLIK